MRSGRCRRGFPPATMSSGQTRLLKNREAWWDREASRPVPRKSTPEHDTPPAAWSDQMKQSRWGFPQSLQRAREKGPGSCRYQSPLHVGLHSTGYDQDLGCRLQTPESTGLCGGIALALSASASEGNQDRPRDTPRNEAMEQSTARRLNRDGGPATPRGDLGYWRPSPPQSVAEPPERSPALCDCWTARGRLWRLALAQHGRCLRALT